jgi:hypothetical protein
VDDAGLAGAGRLVRRDDAGGDRLQAGGLARRKMQECRAGLAGRRGGLGERDQPGQLQASQAPPTAPPDARRNVRRDTSGTILPTLVTMNAAPVASIPARN